ncbi:MAG: hypothetical protein EAZ24_07985 [Burkholderiales bacterium]|nr:MAG: hypothetical protein EAZ24_07985 [Burkholderiales bacterium]TAG78953.1 MAG: hypothetical protein EAZ21_11615 [Betaproteobacteria bacterium]
MKITALFLATAITFGSSSVFAAGNHDHSPKHGGIIAEGKSFDVEFVGKPDSLALHVSDHGKPMLVKGATAKITMLNGTTKTEAELKPTDDGRKLEAKGAFTVTKGTKLISVITLAGKSPTTLRFEVK